MHFTSLASTSISQYVYLTITMATPAHTSKVPESPLTYDPSSNTVWRTVTLLRCAGLTVPDEEWASGSF